MIFYNFSDYGTDENNFLKKKYIGYTNLNRIHTSTGNTPNSSTAMGNTKKESLCKAYSEFLERYSMGLSLLKNNNIKIIDYIKMNFVNSNSINFSYGYNINYGYCDTTGTATGYNSSFIVEKAITELVEKNDLYKFWYKNKGQFVYIKNNKILNNFISDEIFCFTIQEYSNYPTVIIIGFLNKKLISSGISCACNFKMAENNALNEMRIIEWQNFKNNKSVIYNENDLNHEIYNFIKNKSKTLKKYIKIEYDESKVKLSSEITTLEISIINTRKGIKTIKCSSRDLLNCIPRKENMFKYKNNNILNCPLL